MNEIPRIEKWIVSVLRGDAALVAIIDTRVYFERVPNGAEFPLVLGSLLSASDSQGLGTKRLLTRPLYFVRGITKGYSQEDAITMADRIDEVLQNKSAETFENFVFSVRREQPRSYTEPGADNQQHFRHLGGIYRIECFPI